METLVRGAASLGITLTDVQAEQFRLYRDALLDWNQRVNLTAITDPADVERLHFLDSLTLCLAVPHDTLRRARLLDVGTGGGFPGLPLKIAFPTLSLALVEATGKKVEFLEHLIVALKLDGVEVYQGRAEELAHVPGLRGTFDVATARGLDSLGVLAELALSFCRIGGLVVAFKKGDVGRELDRARNALETLGGQVTQVKQVGVEGLADGRVLVVVEKVFETPPRYPRRAGIPHKRPL
jgi:16S rRNA (guanine527-N7)-methyltransferase